MSAEQGTLGTPAAYEVFITRYWPHQTHSRCAFNSLSWGRRLSEMSEATVECDFFGDLYDEDNVRAKTWSHGLRIERVRSQGGDNDIVWWGPLRDIDIDATTGRATLMAVDAMGLCGKRRLREHGPNDDDRQRLKIPIEEADVAAVFGLLIGHAMQPDLRGLEPPAFSTGVVTTRTYKIADYELILTLINELEKLVRWTVVANELVAVGIDGVAGSSVAVGGGWYPTYGIFNTSVFSELPRLHEAGDEQATEVVIPGADNGEEGFRQAWIAEFNADDTGVLTRVQTSTFFRPTDEHNTNWDKFFTSLATQMLTTWYRAPVTLQGGTLNADAPLAINEIIPGTAWALDLDSRGLPIFAGVQLLDSIDVQVTKDDEGTLSEAVRPTLVPLSTIGLTL